jgi:hypothetical protein
LSVAKRISGPAVYRGGPRLPERLFGPITSQLETVEASGYSCEHKSDIDALEQLIFGGPGTVDVVHDACAHVGGFALPMAVRRPAVRFLCTEADPATCAVLRRNIARVRPGNVTAVEASAARMHCPEAQVVYLDPPWGGPAYREAAELPLYLDGANVVEVMARKRNVRQVLKAPLNYRRADLAPLERPSAPGGAANRVTWSEVRSPDGRPRFLVAVVEPLAETVAARPEADDATHPPLSERFVPTPDVTPPACLC